jgi:hypothetical protein
MNKVKELFSGTKRKVEKGILAASTGLAVLAQRVPVLASTTGFAEFSGAKSSSGIVNGVIDFVGIIGTYGGAMYGAFAVYTLILAIRNEDNEGRNKAILNLVAAIALIATSSILKTVLLNN